MSKDEYTRGCFSDFLRLIFDNGVTFGREAIREKRVLSEPQRLRDQVKEFSSAAYYERYKSVLGYNAPMLLAEAWSRGYYAGHDLEYLNDSLIVGDAEAPL